MISIPFPGSKKYSYKRVKQIVEAGDYTNTFELFGGSGVLSVNLFNDHVVDRAVLNDYDGLFDIYGEFLDWKDWIVENCEAHGFRRLIQGGKQKPYYYDADGRRIYVDSFKLNEEQIQFLQSLISQVPKKFWRLLTYGCNFNFPSVSSHPTINLSDFTYFQSYVYTDKQRNYLEVVKNMERAQLDYKDFLDTYQNEFNEHTLLIVDPPYCDTYQKHYQGQFTENQTLELLHHLKDTGRDFIFFNHDVEKVKLWFRMTDLDYKTIEQTGNANTTANRHRKDVLVYHTV